MTNESYVDFFIQTQLRFWNQFVDLLANPSWSNSVYLILASVLVLYALEWIVPWKKSRRVWRAGFGLDVFYTFFNNLLFWWLGGYALCHLSATMSNDFLLSAFGIQNLVALELQSLPGWIQLALIFVLYDLFGYIGHWMLHRFDFLWEFHKVHHAAKELDVWNSARAHWLQNFLYRFILFVPLSMIGFSVDFTVGATFIYYLFSNYSHANLNLPLGPLRYVINNPQMHIWHHDRTTPMRGSVNYGAALVIWDYLLGTAYVPRDKSVGELGFEGMEEFPNGFVREMIYPFQQLFRRARNYRTHGSDSSLLPNVH